ncbi:hypothetical protein DORFOR_02333 [Dorea formicigenerans ATCC 27755]|uniref:Uncharacterized protein n=1 Tax=Dorea formicigenerans ATCC 27755 TaxID=411461 RepID=B0G7S8_9FIRM|nr:hypothetical protein DORFOR_02333 [Dorea formicigenerans ATCC 27755]
MTSLKLRPSYSRIGCPVFSPDSLLNVKSITNIVFCIQYNY